MASIIFNSAIGWVVRGAIDFEHDIFYVMLCTSAYRANKQHSARPDITSEVIGYGYDAGGAPVDVTVVRDMKNDRIDVMLGEAAWQNATITARYGIYYRRGGELIAAIDFGKDVVSTNGTFSLSASTLRFQN